MTRPLEELSECDGLKGRTKRIAVNESEKDVKGGFESGLLQYIFLVMKEHSPELSKVMKGLY